MEMKGPIPARPVERLFPFVMKARILLLGRETLLRSKSKLHFVLVTHDLSENSREEILSDFEHYPIVQHYTTEDLARFFGIEGAKVVGFQKSGLAQSLYAELKAYRINRPAAGSQASPIIGSKRAPKTSLAASKSSGPFAHECNEQSGPT